MRLKHEAHKDNAFLQNICIFFNFCSEDTYSAGQQISKALYFSRRQYSNYKTA